MSDTATLLSVFSAQIRFEDGSYLIDVPAQEVGLGEIEPEEVYRIAILPSKSDTQPGPNDPKSPAEPPVKAGGTLEVEIEDIGSKGDGVARLSGYVIFVPDTTLRERVTVEVTEVRETMAFAEVIGRHDT